LRIHWEVFCYKYLKFESISSRVYWYNCSGFKFDKLPSDSFASPCFSRFALIQNLVWMDFPDSDLKIKYMGKDIIKWTNFPVKLIGDIHKQSPEPLFQKINPKKSTLGLWQTIFLPTGCIDHKIVQHFSGWMQISGTYCFLCVAQ